MTMSAGELQAAFRLRRETSYVGGELDWEVLRTCFLTQLRHPLQMGQQLVKHPHPLITGENSKPCTHQQTSSIFTLKILPVREGSNELPASSDTFCLRAIRVVIGSREGWHRKWS